MKSSGDAGSPKTPLSAGKSDASGEAPHLSRLICIDEVPDAGLSVKLVADAAECAAVARAAGLVAVSSLEADLDVSREGAARFRVEGALRAMVVQTCVVSLDAFDSPIEAHVEADFAIADQPPAAVARGGRKAASSSATRAALSMPQGDDAPDPIVDGRVDLGALVEEFLILNLDPYPRQPGVEFEPVEFPGESEEASSPFAALKKLKDRE